MADKITGFHIDMNMAQYRADYLKRWLARLAQAGYNTILWEVENNVRFESCSECASPDAFSKDEFRALLAECRSLGLEPIPLFQTIGHAEYVLKHPAYAHLKELPDQLDQYCPQNPELMPFLHGWIDEYLDLFAPLRIFHIGADEAWWLGDCPKCKAYAQEHSLSQLYIEHVSRVIEPLLAKGITPALWADMLLHYPEGIDQLSRQVMLFDWIYSVYPGSGKVHVWGQGLVPSEDLDKKTRARFGAYLYPQGNEPGREAETFYTADYLAAQGFQVVTCPAASSYGDNVFSPRTWLHSANTFGSFKKGRQKNLRGSLLTSWSVHLFPWELQWSALAVPTFLDEHPRGHIEDYPAWFNQQHFGAPGEDFWQAAGLLSKSCLFSHTASLGFSKDCRPVRPHHVRQTLSELAAAGGIENEKANCARRLVEYGEALERLDAFSVVAARNLEELDLWKLFARCLRTRARSSLFLLEHSQQVISANPLSRPDLRTAQARLADEQACRAEMEQVYHQMIRPTRAAEMVTYPFGAVEEALMQLGVEDERL